MMAARLRDSRLGFAAAALGLTLAIALFATRVATADQEDVRSASAARWLGVSSVSLDRGWQLESGPAGTHLRAIVRGVGPVDLDPGSLEVTQVIYDSELRGTAGSPMTVELARVAAEGFARSHQVAIDSMALHDSALLRHGIFDEYRFTWRPQRAGAWLADFVAVGVNAADGRVAYLSRHRSKAVVPDTRPTVTRDAALAAARATTPRPAEQLAVTGPELEVREVPGGEARLIWTTVIRPAVTAPAFISDVKVVVTDARTGKTAVEAAG